MNILLDTNIFIWFSQDDSILNTRMKRIIEDENNSVFISVATFWEIAIKKSINKLELNLSLKELYNKCIENGFEILTILYEHTEQIESLPYHHKDPFDRILIAQAIVENLFIITSDDVFSKYNINLI